VKFRLVFSRVWGKTEGVGAPGALPEETEASGIKGSSTY